jgi:hypothetical protein
VWSSRKLIADLPVSIFDHIKQKRRARSVLRLGGSVDFLIINRSIAREVSKLVSPPQSRAPPALQ